MAIYMEAICRSNVKLQILREIQLHLATRIFHVVDFQKVVYFVILRRF